jgi:polar amino acid transport system permease protein
MNVFVTDLIEWINYAGGILPALLAGAWVTVKLFFWTLLFSLPLGLPFALGSSSRIWPIRALCRAYVFVFRGTPLLLQLFFFYFFLPIAFDITMDAFTTGVITFILNYAAYFAEIYRGGINGIDKGQYEAAHALGLSKRQTMFGIILPQTFRIILPPVSNEAIVLVKDTALVSVIAVSELMKASRGAVNRDVDMTAYILAAVIYLLMTLLLTILSNYLEKRSLRYDGKEAG